MIIKLKKFGTTLTSRDDGKGAYNAIQVLLRSLGKKEELIIDFKDVYAFSPSWGDEFLTNLYKKYKDRLVLLNTENPSVIATLDLLTEINDINFTIKKAV